MIESSRFWPLCATWAMFSIALLAPLTVARPATVEFAQKGVPIPTGEDDEIAARAFDTQITWKDLEPLIYARRAMSKDGRGVLRHLSESKLLEKLAVETGVEISAAQIETRIRELDSQVLATGEKEGIEGYLRKARLSRAEFTRVMRLGLVQETLTRRALGLKDNDPVTGDQQRLWMDAALTERQYNEFTPPWKDGVVAQSSEFTVKGDEFLRYLRLRLPPETLLEDCWQLLLVKRIRARMPDLAPEKLAKYVSDELNRRRDDTKNDPRYKGLSYESILGSQGVLTERMSEDPAVLIAALSKLWVDRSYDAESLKRLYQDEREAFDGTYGPAVETAMIFLRAAQFKNELNPRTFAEALKELALIKGRVRTIDEFKEIAKEKTEDAPTRDLHGALGYLTAKAAKLPNEVRAEIAKAIATPQSASAEGSLVGPLRVANGCVLLWFGSRRPAPAWDVMANQVKSELRRRFVEEVLPRSALVTVFEVQ